jgi:hypothetical protein
MRWVLLTATLLAAAIGRSPSAYAVHLVPRAQCVAECGLRPPTYSQLITVCRVETRDTRKACKQTLASQGVTRRQQLLLVKLYQARIRDCRHNRPCPTTTTTSTTTTSTIITTATTTTTTPTTGSPTTTTTLIGCAARPDRAPYQITFTVPPAAYPAHPELGNGSDLDEGWTGTSHDFPVVSGTSLKYCLSGCDGRTTFDCQGNGPTGPQTLNGRSLGAPLPLLAANVPVCVVNRYQPGDLQGTFNLQTGDAGTPENPNVVKLFSDIYLRTAFPGEICPRCNVAEGAGTLGDIGTCSDTAKNAGATCRIDGEATIAGQGLYLLSSDCSPLGDNPQPNGTLDIQLKFTTGTTSLAGPTPCPDSAGPQTQDDNCGSGSCTAACTGSACVGTNDKGECIDPKGGISQLCCSNNTSTPCFPTKGGGSIVRTGAPATDGHTALFASTFCIPRTNATLINVTTGLPGPGALLLPAQVQVAR